MLKHPCFDGLTKECFSKYPTFFKKAIAYRSLFTIIPKTVLALLQKGLDQPLIGSEVTIPTGIQFPPGWTVFPDVEFPPGWTLNDPPPAGVFSPPKFTPKLPETGPSGPLFTIPFEPGPPHPPGLIIESPSLEEQPIYIQGPGDTGRSLGHDPIEYHLAGRVDQYISAIISRVKIKIGAVGSPVDQFVLKIREQVSDWEPGDVVMGGEASPIQGPDFPVFSVDQEYVDFWFPGSPQINSSIRYFLSMENDGIPDPNNYYKALKYDNPAGLMFHRSTSLTWGTSIPETLDLQIYGIPL